MQRVYQMADLMVYPKVYLKAARKAVPMAVLLVGQLARLAGITESRVLRWLTLEASARIEPQKRHRHDDGDD